MAAAVLHVVEDLRAWVWGTAAEDCKALDTSWDTFGGCGF
jgi:hypothetical protein